MTTATETLSGKTHRDENFPVASWLMSARHRGPILAFYRFVRAADDVADSSMLSMDQKLAMLDGLGDALCGRGPEDPEAEPLRLALRERGLSPRHALDLLDAFRLDARKSRYANWAELMDYCRLSAMPVGRFVLDVHNEDEAIWPASDALCAALQVINHLQDCAEDYRRLDRVYLPQNVLAEHGASIEMLGAPRASAALRRRHCGTRPARFGARGAWRGAHPPDRRCPPGARDLRDPKSCAAPRARPQTRDPLSQPVHLGKGSFALVGGAGVLRGLASMLIGAVRTRPKVRA